MKKGLHLWGVLPTPTNPPTSSWFKNKALQSSLMPLRPFSVNWFSLFLVFFISLTGIKKKKKGGKWKDGCRGRWWREQRDGWLKMEGKMKRVKGLKRRLRWQKEECIDGGGLATNGLTGVEDGGIMEAEQLGSRSKACWETRCLLADTAERARKQKS